MKIAVFTSNQARHIYLIEQLQLVSTDLLVFVEATSLFPGRVQDFYRKSTVMEEYFSLVVSAERSFFGAARALPNKISVFPMKMGDVSHLDVVSTELSDCDFVVVFGASYIRGALADLLIAMKAVNLHMGVSPYFRGTACNFWALYDGRPGLVGGTVHYLSRGLDSGPILFNARPAHEGENGFEFGMKAVKVTIDELVRVISSESILSIDSRIQDPAQLIRYSRNADFTDEVATHYLRNRGPLFDLSAEEIENEEKQLILPPSHI